MINTNDMPPEQKNAPGHESYGETRRSKMGFAISKVMADTQLEKLKSALEKNSLQDVSKQIKEELNLLNSTTLDIAITGVAGAGKSSLVNALRGMHDSMDDAAKTGGIETTMEAKKYPHPTFPKVTIWDLPGIGTTKFQAKEYLKMTNLAEYDFFIIAAERFTEHDVLLAKEIQKMKKRYYFVRSKIDSIIMAEKRKPNFNEEETLAEIRKYCSENLRKAGEPNPRVFLIFSWDLSAYDFPLLQDTLEKELDDLKRQVIIESMPAFSKEALQKKNAAMEALIWKVALVSCAIGAIPLPSLSLVCDVSILGGTMVKFCRVFGLDEESLGRLAQRVGKPIDELKPAIKKAPLANQITKEFVLDLLSKSLLCEAMVAVDLVLKITPVLGSLAGGAASFVTVFFILKSFLNDIKEDAENVLAKVTELQDK
ncbi:UNVERIFIED_CONTAM: hypothetical protein K2H54_026261 [Gekko kuhli]